MKDGELKVYYKGKVDNDLDLSLDGALSFLGFECWASGYNLETDTRDLAFKKRNINKAEGGKT